MTLSASPVQPDRPNLMATRHVVVAGHYLAAHAGFEVLEAGGNAVDAGVAAGLALGVVEGVFHGLAGVAPIILYLADRDEVVTISGLGTWPRLASCAYFHEHHGGTIPSGILRSVVPAAADAWVTALEHYGTMTFTEVAEAATRFARDGFPMYPLMAALIGENAEAFRASPPTAEIFLPGGRPPAVGEIFVQADLARTLQFLADEETAAGRGGREAGLRAVRDAFYRGDIAATIDRYYRESGGLLRAEDMAAFRVGIEPPVRTRFGDVDVFGCGPWSQGPMLLQELNLLDGTELHALGHNAPAYVHRVTEAIKLAAADREAYYGDPRFVDVPMDALLSRQYAKRRRALIDPERAAPDMPEAGRIEGAKWPAAGATHVKPSAGSSVEAQSARDTTYVCAVDRHGNAFSATPSDGAYPGEVGFVPGTGLVPSWRGACSRPDPGHPNCVAPGKRPRLTPNPALAIRRGKAVMPFGTPGGDVQTQAMLQTFLNIFVFGMDPQSAVEAPRFASYSFSATYEPYEHDPGRLNLEGRFDGAVAEALETLGHRVRWWPERIWLAGSVCAVLADLETGVRWGAADPRRTAYAVGW